jgi:catechol 2,3-dioxygenase-like lactoylglutathione lyase family enzyme
MLQGIDHIVIVVRDLEQAAKDYEKLGFTVVPGGKHPVGSHNALISFADGSYIEIISFYRPSPDHRWWAPLQIGEGLVDYCMQTDDLTGDTAKFRDAGVKINDPVPWSRVRPDGYELKWVLSLAQQECRGVAPFLIQDLTPRDERVPQKFDHPNGTKGIGAVTVAVEDVNMVRRWYQNALGADGTDVSRADLDAAGTRFRVGPHRLDFVRPQSKNSPLSEPLRKRGSSPYSATLVTSLSQPPSLDSSLSHGAILSFE